MEQNQSKEIREKLQNGNYTKEALIDMVIANYETHSRIHQELAVQNEQLKTQNRMLSKAIDKRVSAAGTEKISEIVKSDWEERVKQRAANIRDARVRRVKTERKETVQAHYQVISKEAKEKIVVPVSGKVMDLIQTKRKEIEARKRLSNIKRIKRERARNEFFGKVNEKTKQMTEYFARHKANVAHHVKTKPVEIAKGFMEKVNQIKTSYQTKVQEAKVQIAATKSKSAGKGL